MKKQIVIDVEATGPCPGLYSMVQLGAATLDGDTFYAEMRPLYAARVRDAALDAIGLTREQIDAYPLAQTGVIDFVKWIDDITGGERPVTWSDNPGFDWQFVNYYLWAFAGHNPLGYSMRRIGDLYAGAKHDPRKTSDWKRYRQTKHTHNALDDAKGNAEAMTKVLDIVRMSKP